MDLDLIMYNTLSFSPFFFPIQTSRPQILKGKACDFVNFKAVCFLWAFTDDLSMKGIIFVLFYISLPLPCFPTYSISFAFFTYYLLGSFICKRSSWITCQTLQSEI
jgi:hypothetical protein